MLSVCGRRQDGNAISTLGTGYSVGANNVTFIRACIRACCATALAAGLVSCENDGGAGGVPLEEEGG